MFKSIVQLIIIGLLLVDLFCILCSKFFVPSPKKMDDKENAKRLLKKINLTLYLIFVGLAIVLILINVF